MPAQEAVDALSRRVEAVFQACEPLPFEVVQRRLAELDTELRGTDTDPGLLHDLRRAVAAEAFREAIRKHASVAVCIEQFERRVSLGWNHPLDRLAEKCTHTVMLARMCVHHGEKDEAIRRVEAVLDEMRSALERDDLTDEMIGKTESFLRDVRADRVGRF